MTENNNIQETGIVNSPIILRKNQIKKIFDSEAAYQKMQPYFEDKKKLDRFKQTLMIIAMDDSLRYAEPESILKCGLQAAEIGLPIEKALGQVFLVVYDGKLTLSVSYKGWQALFDRDRKSIKAHSVYDCDQFNMHIGDHNEHFDLKEDHETRKESDSKWVMAHLKGVIVSILNVDTDVTFNKFVPFDKLNQLRLMSPAIKKNKFSPWTNFTAEMFRAKAIKWVASKSAMSKSIARAIEIENKNEMEHQNLLPKKKSFLEYENIDQPIDVASNPYLTTEGNEDENND